jgi:hypothetical protein
MENRIKQFIKKYIVKNKIKAKKIDYQSQFEEGVYFKAQKEFLEKQKIGSIKSWWNGKHAWIYWYICDCCDLLHKKGFFKKSK